MARPFVAVIFNAPAQRAQGGVDDSVRGTSRPAIARQPGPVRTPPESSTRPGGDRRGDQRLRSAVR